MKNECDYLVCPVCGLKWLNPPFKGYNEPLCWICYLKSKKYYQAAIEEIKTGWFNWSTGLLKYKTGWSFAFNVSLTAVFIAVLKSPVLNKMPRTTTTLNDYFSNWQIKIANEYYAPYRGKKVC